MQDFSLIEPTDSVIYAGSQGRQSTSFGSLKNPRWHGTQLPSDACSSPAGQFPEVKKNKKESRLVYDRIVTNR